MRREYNCVAGTKLWYNIHMKKDASTSKPVRNVLWTSGWDSTYMILKMLREGETVQPIYIINPRRKSRFIEMEAMERLEQKIHERVKTGKLLPAKKYDLREIKIDKAIKKASKQISRALIKDGRRPLGYQYEYLASFAKTYHTEYPILSLGVEKSSEAETGGLGKTIRLFGKLTTDLRVDREASQPMLVTLLGDFDFPIIDVSEPQMVADIHAWKYEDIMKGIWFCHKPIRGQACGFCSPCRQKGISDMDFLLSEEALRRFRKFKGIEQKYGRRARIVADFCYRLTQPKK